MDKERFIGEMLLLPSLAIEYNISKNLVELFPGKGVIEGEGGNFNVEAYAQAGKCSLNKHTFSYNQVSTHWWAPEPEMMHWQRTGMRMQQVGPHAFAMIQQEFSPAVQEQDTVDMLKKAWLEAQWQGHTLDILILHLEGENFFKMRFWIVAESEEIARAFLAAVCKWNSEIRSEVLVFDSGHWHKDERLFQDIKNATFDNLVLRGSLKQEIRDDLAQFFSSRAIYDEHDIPWKRGILFIGPAGNGKTHAVKALVNSIEQPCLYVRSFRAPQTHGADEINIRQVFERARRSAPCVLVLEDLDALISPQNRSFFLNELDGFAANIGIVTLATTNHPERLDPAILDRPSRFDRKYHFDLPEQAERQAYLNLWNSALKPDLRLTDAGVNRIMGLTDGFSFAYLKELFLSAKMRWINNPQQGTMEDVMVGQVSLLHEQMTSTNTLSESGPEEEIGLPPHFGPGMHMRRPR